MRRVVQLVEHAAQRGDAAVAGDLQCRADRRPRVAFAIMPAAASQRVGVGELELDVPAGDSALEFGGGAFGDDPPVIEHRDTVGELVGLLEVLGGEEDRHAVARPARG